MNLADYLHQPFVIRLGWSLLHFLWQGAAIGLVAVLVMIVLKQRSPQARYTALLILLGLCMTSPMATFAWLNKFDTRSMTTTLSAAPSQPSDSPPIHRTTNFAQSKGERTFNGARTPVGTASPVDQDRYTRFRPWHARLSPTVETLVPWIAVGWWCGVIMLTIQLLGGWWSVQWRLIHHAQPLGNDWQPVTARLAAALQVRTAVRWLESSASLVPLTVGWLHPVVVVPVSVLSGLRPVEVECLLAHELAHIRRHDYMVNMLQCAVEVLLFFHPIVWWLSRLIRHERETICDDLTVGVTGDGVVYSRALLSVAELAQRPPGLSVAASGGELKERVQRLLGVPTTGRLVPGPTVICLVLLSGGMGLLLTHSQYKNRTATFEDARSVIATRAAEFIGDGNFLLPPISGQVVDSQGQVQKDVPVFLRKSVSGLTSGRSPSMTADLATTVTDTGGRFRFSEVPETEDGRRVDVVAVADGYALAWCHLSGDVAQEDVRLVLRPQSQLSGRIVNESGDPVSEANVQLSHVMSIRHVTQADLEEGRWPRSDDAQFISLLGFRTPPVARTDREGRFILSGLPAERGLILEVVHPRFQMIRAYAATVEAIDPKNASRAKRDVQTGEVEVSLSRGRRLDVQVVYEDTGEPAVGARFPNIVNSIVFPPSLEVNESGRFQVAHLDRPDVSLYVYPPDGSDYLGTMERVEFPDDVYEKSLTVRLTRGAVISGRIVDAETGDGIVGVPLWAIAPPQPLVNGRQSISFCRTSSQADGTFRVASVPGDVTLAVHGMVPGYQTSVGGTGAPVLQLASVQIPVTSSLDAAVEGITIELPRAAVVSGTVYDSEGRPAGSVTMTGEVAHRIGERDTSWHSFNEVTTENGLFLLDQLHPAWAADNDPRPVEVMFRDRERDLGRLVLIEPPKQDDPREQRLDVHLQPLGIVTGRFINADTGKPVVGVSVTLCRQRSDQTDGTWHPASPKFRTSVDGRFELVGIVGGVEHGIVVTDPRFRQINSLETRFVGKYGDRHELGDVELIPLQPPVGQRLQKVAAPSVHGLAPEAAYKLLTEHFTVDNTTYRQAFEKAAAGRKRDHLVEQLEPTPVYAEALRKLAEANPNSDVELRSLIWILNCVGIVGSEKAVLPLKSPAAERLLEAFADRQELVECVPGLLTHPFDRMNRKERAIAAAERLLEKNPYRDVQGLASYEVARRIARDHLTKPSPRELEMAIKYLQRVVDEYADIPHPRGGTLGEAAEQDLSELR